MEKPSSAILGLFFGDERLRLILVLLLLPLWLEASEFTLAEQAANEGRYRDVVDLLSAALDSGELNDNSRLVAFSNRGIAYSLLNAYGLAKQDLNRALKINPKHDLSLNQLGILAEKVERDYESAANYYEIAVEARFPPSEANLAHLYRMGLGVPQNRTRAFELYRSAVAHGYKMALTPLAQMYLGGEGTSRNAKQARNLFKQATAEGVINAHYLLGMMMERGTGGPRDLKQAVENYLIAATQGHGEAQNALGYMYRRGAGVKQDLIEAARWYDLAAEQGILGAKNRLSWLLAGCPTRKICDGERAVELALEVVAQSPAPGHRDSLAAAYARVGNFDSAVSTMREVLADSSIESSRRIVFQRRLDGYKNGIPNQL